MKIAIITALIATAIANEPATKFDLSRLDVQTQNCIKRCATTTTTAGQVACYEVCVADDAELVAALTKSLNSDRLPGNAQIQALYEVQMTKALAKKDLPYTSTFTPAQINQLYTDGSMVNPYTGAVLGGKPPAAEPFKMSAYEGGGLRRDLSAPDKEGKFTNAQVGAPLHTDAIVATFESMSNADCIVQDDETPCYFKCLARYEIGKTKSSVDDAVDDGGSKAGGVQLQEGDEVRFVPFDFPECECAEGTGIYAGVGQPTTLTFSEATGVRSLEATIVGDGAITMKFASLALVTGVECSATFRVRTSAADDSAAVTKQFADGNRVTIDYSKLKRASEMQKRMGAKVPAAGSDEAADVLRGHASVYDEVLKESLARILSTSGGGGRARRKAGRFNNFVSAITGDSASAVEVQSNLPSSYDVREEYPRCAAIVRDQGSCGSCWAFSTSGVLSQRTCIANQNLDSNFVLSPQSMLTCDKDCFLGTDVCNGGCEGGYTALAFQTMVAKGSTPEHCVGYTSFDGVDQETCGSFTIEGTVMHSIGSCELEDAESDTTIRAATSYSLSSEAEMMSDIYLNGPIQATFLMENDLYGYESGIYQCSTDGGDLGGHATIAVGWGEENGIKYWIVQNSWGADWGEGGHVKIRRGINTCGIESNADAATAPRAEVTFLEEDNAVQDTTSGVAKISGMLALVASSIAAAVVSTSTTFF